MSRRSAEKKHKIHLGIRPRLFLSLAAMTLLCMVVQWVFQIRLLGYFYERERFDEIQELAVGLSSLVGDDALISQVQASAEEHSACIRVFCLEEGSAQDGQKEAVLVADAEANGQCMIHHMPSEQLSKIYDRVKENGGVYDRRMETRKSFKSDEDSFRVPGFHEPSNNRPSNMPSNNRPSNMSSSNRPSNMSSNNRPNINRTQGTGHSPIMSAEEKLKRSLKGLAYTGSGATGSTGSSLPGISDLMVMPSALPKDFGECCS